MPARRYIRAVPLAAVAVALLGLPATAPAAVINVSTAGADNPMCGSAGSPCKTLGYVVANRVTAEPDTIAVASGEHIWPGTAVAQANATGDTIQGAGSGGLPGGTVLRHSNAGQDAQLQLDVAATVRALSVRLPAGAAASRRAVAIGSGAGNSAVDDVAVTVENAATASIVSNSGASGVAFARLRVSGNLVGDALTILNATGNTVRDAVLKGGTSPTANALSINSSNPLVQRSHLFRDFAAAGLDPVVETISSQLTVESSLVTGGRIGFNSQAVPPANSSLVLRSVTIDIANPGSGDAPPDRHPIYVRTTMPGAASSTARVERSIFFEQVYAFAEAGSTVKVECFDSLLPQPHQENAMVACGAANGNSSASALATFVNSPGGNYHLQPESPAIDGASTELAGGESTTDLDGNPRLLDGNRDCVARVDRGAYEKTGQTADPATCPAPPGDPGPGDPPVDPPVGPPVNPPIDPPPVLDRVSFARSEFRSQGAKRGTKLRFRLSEAASVNVAIDRALAGRRQNGKCRKPSRANRNGTRCTHYDKLGSFTVAGALGSSSVPFSGRLKGKALRAGAYRARLRARDGAGLLSAERSASFRVLR